MKYTKELTDQLLHLYTVTQLSVPECAAALTLSLSENEAKRAAEAGTPAETTEVVPDRSVIAKLSSLGVYKKKEYLTKRGEVPVKKEEYIDRIALLLDVNAEFLESLEKVNKGVLQLISTKLSEYKSE